VARLPIPTDPVERIRVIRVLREAWRRRQKPCLEATERHVNDRVYGPYFVARFRPGRAACRRRGRTVYLGVPGKESVEAVEELLELSKRDFLALATKIVRNLHSILRSLLDELPPFEKRAKAVILHRMTWSFSVRGDSLKDPIPSYPERLRGFIIRVLGRWYPGYSGVLGRLLSEVIGG